MIHGTIVLPLLFLAFAGCNEGKPAPPLSWFQVLARGPVDEIGAWNETVAIDGDVGQTAPELAAALDRSLEQEYVIVEGNEAVARSMAYLERFGIGGLPVDVEYQGWYYSLEPPHADL